MKILLIKSKAYIPTDKLMKFHDSFVKQVESGVVVIPEYFDAEIINVPDEVKVVYEFGGLIFYGYDYLHLS